MTPKTTKRLVFAGIVALIGGFLLMDALHVFDDADYFEIPHGSHSHYVPRDRDPNVPLENFPSTPPRPNEKIMPNGEVVPK
jgi:hypothetical protein